MRGLYISDISAKRQSAAIINDIIKRNTGAPEKLSRPLFLEQVHFTQYNRNENSVQYRLGFDRGNEAISRIQY